MCTHAREQECCTTKGDGQHTARSGNTERFKHDDNRASNQHHGFSGDARARANARTRRDMQAREKTPAHARARKRFVRRCADARADTTA
eukprot:548111-Pyramimonas_sp.AAC.1